MSAPLNRWDDVYHIVMRGITRRQVFMDEQDCAKMVELLGRCKGAGDFTLYAYCVAGDALHLLIGLTHASVNLLFGSIEQVYVAWYNHKYVCEGALFEERLKCMPINSDQDLIDDMVTIHMEPVRQGLCRLPGDYAYSSYREYLTPSRDTLTSTACLRQLTGTRFAELHVLPPHPHGLSEKKAWALSALLSGVQDAASLKQLDPQKQAEWLRTLNAHDVPRRLLRRMTGLPVKSLARILDGNPPRKPFP